MVTLLSIMLLAVEVMTAWQYCNHIMHTCGMIFPYFYHNFKIYALLYSYKSHVLTFLILDLFYIAIDFQVVRCLFNYNTTNVSHNFLLSYYSILENQCLNIKLANFQMP